MWKTWANLLTLARLACVPLCVCSVLDEQWVTAALIFTFAVATDFADGPLARHYHHASPLGGLFDHATDALFVAANLAVLAYSGYINAWLPILVAAAFVQYTLDSRALAGSSLRTSWLGKNNGVAYYVLVGIPIIRNAFELSWPRDTWISAIGWLLLLTTLLSMGERAVTLINRSAGKSSP